MIIVIKKICRERERVKLKCSLIGFAHHLSLKYLKNFANYKNQKNFTALFQTQQ
jgi:hypothetical protein